MVRRPWFGPALWLDKGRYALHDECRAAVAVTAATIPNDRHLCRLGNAMTVLDGKVVLLAGASSGMGRATALAVAEAGGRLALLARRADALADVAAEVKTMSGAVVTVAADATTEQGASTAVAQTLRCYGRVDVVVNSVGTNIKKRTLLELTLTSWNDLLHANLDAAFVLTQAALPVFRDQHDGLFVHISSSAAKRPDTSGVGYQASKAGVAALAHATMVEERANGVRVSVIYPGLTATPMVNNRPTPPSPAELADALQPNDVAQMCLAVMSLPQRAYVPELMVYPSRL